MEKEKVILSGIQPSGKLTIGHLIGALNSWVELQNSYECYFMIADLHAITLKQKPIELQKNTFDCIAMYIACGIDPTHSTLFVQSHIPEHSQLQWVLTCWTGMGECAKMTQFKEKSQNKQEQNINVGLFSYPVLQAADILLYQADLVPVGEDQKQHLELSRNLAQRFNHHYSETFKIPEPFIPKVGARIMSLQEPTKKMSKSDDNERNIIFLSDTDEQIKDKIKRSVTDSGQEIRCADDKPGITNLLTLYSVATNIPLKEVENNFAGKSYGDFKSAVADAVIEYVKPVREKFFDVRGDKKYIQTIIAEGAEKASKVAFKTLRKVYKKVGFVPLEALLLNNSNIN